jgi:hypothetical protein
MRWNHFMLELIPEPDLIDSESKKKNYELVNILKMEDQYYTIRYRVIN